MLIGGVGCSSSPRKQAILSEREIPIAVKRGETFIAPWDGIYMDKGRMYQCEWECLQRAMGN